MAFQEEFHGVINVKRFAQPKIGIRITPMASSMSAGMI